MFGARVYGYETVARALADQGLALAQSALSQPAGPPPERPAAKKKVPRARTGSRPPPPPRRRSSLVHRDELPLSDDDDDQPRRRTASDGLDGLQQRARLRRRASRKAAAASRARRSSVWTTQPGEDPAHHPMAQLRDDDTKDAARSLVLNAAQAFSVHAQMTPLARLYDWWLEFSLQRDGASLATLVQRVGRIQGATMLLLVRDTGGRSFGAVLPSGLCVGDRSYHGAPGAQVFTCVGPGGGRALAFDARDNMQVAITSDLLVIGSGGQGAAICIDSELNHGSSHRSHTFDNEPLASAPEFECWQVEVWRVGL